MGPIHQCLYAAVTAVYETDKIVFSNPKGRPADATVVICAVPWNFNEFKTLVEDAAIAVGRRSSLLKPQRRATDEDVDERGPDYRDVEVLVGQFTRTVVNSLVYARLYAMQEMESRLTVFNETRAVTPTLYQRDRKEYKLITRNAIVALEYDVVSIQASYGHDKAIVATTIEIVHPGVFWYEMIRQNLAEGTATGLGVETTVRPELGYSSCYSDRVPFTGGGKEKKRSVGIKGVNLAHVKAESKHVCRQRQGGFGMDVTEQGQLVGQTLANVDFDSTRFTDAASTSTIAGLVVRGGNWAKGVLDSRGDVETNRNSLYSEEGAHQAPVGNVGQSDLEQEEYEKEGWKLFSMSQHREGERRSEIRGRQRDGFYDPYTKRIAQELRRIVENDPNSKETFGEWSIDEMVNCLTQLFTNPEYMASTYAILAGSECWTGTTGDVGKIEGSRWSERHERYNQVLEETQVNNATLQRSQNWTPKSTVDEDARNKSSSQSRYRLRFFPSTTTTTDGTGKAVEGKYAFTFKSESGKRKRRNGDTSEGDEMGQLEKGQFISK
ncbi:hypothetical protein VKT23_016917 [Stygiomarasmius scandens]|uniref:Uncharacterized protein n=1 Tax=Marasmiellus scandens TaxID=2682957 RepID=A0ABR1IXM1_9AGAR